MGIRFLCPNGHKLNVKAYLAGERGICPQCDAKFLVPAESGSQVESLEKTVSESPATVSPDTVSPTTVSSLPAAPLHKAPHQTAPPPPPPSVPPAVADSTDQWYVRTVAGEQYGPANEPTMRSWISEGRVTIDCWVWRTGWPEWKAAGPAITLLNGPTPLQSPPNEPPASSSVGTAVAPIAAAAQFPETTIPEPTIPEPTSATSLYMSARRNRQERARKVTLFLGVLVLLLFAVLVAVLVQNN